MVTFDEIIIKQTVDKLLKGEDYRSIVVSKINADFLQFAIDFFKDIIKAKCDSTDISLNWYKQNFINNDLISTDNIAIYAGINKKTIHNIKGSATKEVVLDFASENFEYLSLMIKELEDEAFSGLDVVIKLSYNGVSVELSLSESLIVINALATKKIAIRGGAWSSIGKKCEKPLMLKLCELCGVPMENINSDIFKKNTLFDREVDFKIKSNSGVWNRCEVKLMGKGNPESADAIFARESKIFIADTLSKMNKEQAEQWNCEWLELKNNSTDVILKNFKKILSNLDIPYK